MPELAELHPQFKKQGIRLIGLSLDGEAGGVREFAESMGVEYPLYLIDPESLGKIFVSPQFPIPLSLVTDKSGKLVQILPGWNSKTEQMVENLLNE